MAFYPLVEYPNVEVDARSIYVETLSKPKARALAPQLYGLIVRSYSPQFEGNGKPLPSGTFAARYGLDHLDSEARAQRLAQFDDRIKRHYRRGGSYHAVHHPTQAGRVIGSLKVLPGHKVEKRFAGYFGLAEILVDPEVQGRGVGAALLHAGITVGSQHEVRPNQPAMLDAFDGSSVNNWYVNLRFQPEQPSGELRLDDDHALPTTYYATAPGITLMGVAFALQQKHPQLELSRTTLLSK